jgi:hypothetical protein
MKHSLTIIFFLVLVLASCRHVVPPKASFTIHKYWEDALKASKLNTKPILVIFNNYTTTIDALAVMKTPELSAFIDSTYNVVELKVTNQRLLPTEQVFLNKNGRKITSVGQFNADLQNKLVDEYFIPMYVLLDQKGNPLKFDSNRLYQPYVAPENKKEVDLFKKMLLLGKKLTVKN